MRPQQHTGHSPCSLHKNLSALPEWYRAIMVSAQALLDIALTLQTMQPEACRILADSGFADFGTALVCPFADYSTPGGVKMTPVS